MVWLLSEPTERSLLRAGERPALTRDDCFEAYGAELSTDAYTYMQTLLDNPFVQKWINLGRREKEPLSIAYASSA